MNTTRVDVYNSTPDAVYGSNGYVSLSKRNGWYRIIPSTKESLAPVALNSNVDALEFT